MQHIHDTACMIIIQYVKSIAISQIWFQLPFYLHMDNFKLQTGLLEFTFISSYCFVSLYGYWLVLILFGKNNKGTDNV